MDLRLLVVQGKPIGKEIPIKSASFVIGRSDECHLRPNSELVSRTHCQFTVEGETVRLRDLGSSNGTIVNGERITEEVLINDGDMVQVGPLGFQVLLETSSVPEPATVEPSQSQEIPLPQPVLAAAPTSVAAASKATPRVDRLGSREVDHEDIQQWLLSDARNPVPDSGSGVYTGDTQLLNVAALQDTKADHSSQDTPPVGVKKPEENKDMVVEAEGGVRIKIKGEKLKIEKTREDTSRAASDILRSMMERRPR